MEHRLHGEKIVEFMADTPGYQKEKKEGKWIEYPDYAVQKKGRIALQDHGNKAYCRNVMIRPL